MRVLVIEDEQDLAETVRRGLSNEGFTVQVEHNGIDGLRSATDERFDVIALDIMLPGLNGYQVLHEIRDRKIWTPILILTARDGEYGQTDALNLGADDYLTKPFSFLVLTARLRALASRGTPDRPVRLVVGSLTLDPARHVVTRCGEEVLLTAKEFALLHFLMRHHGAIVSKAEILDGVWDPACAVDQSVVEVYVGYLSRKLDAPYQLSTLQTVRGMGYRLVADSQVSA